MEQPHAKWRIQRVSFGWIVQEWNHATGAWTGISIKFKDQRAAYIYLHANALVECVMDNEDWKICD